MSSTAADPGRPVTAAPAPETSILAKEDSSNKPAAARVVRCSAPIAASC